jgi:hypothetical protein
MIVKAAGIPRAWRRIRDEGTIEKMLARLRGWSSARALRSPIGSAPPAGPFPANWRWASTNGRVPLTAGWKPETAAIDFARIFAGEPLAAVIYTDISRDGNEGPNFAAMAEMKAADIPTASWRTTAKDIEGEDRPRRMHHRPGLV